VSGIQAACARKVHTGSTSQPETLVADSGQRASALEHCDGCGSSWHKPPAYLHMCQVCRRLVPGRFTPAQRLNQRFLWGTLGSARLPWNTLTAVARAGTPTTPATLSTVTLRRLHISVVWFVCRLVEMLCYKPEGRGLDPHYGPGEYPASYRNEYQNSSGGGRMEREQARKTGNLTAICEPSVYKMWDPQHLILL
jgi:hypothetical protein